MGVINTKGVEVYLQVGSNTATELVPLTISKANPAEITVADVQGLNVSDVITFADTGFSELDGKTFAIGAIDEVANSFSVLGSDTSSSVGVLGGAPKAKVVTVSDMVKLCLSSMEIGADTVNTIDVSTYCDTSAQIPGKATPGTITLSGYADKNDTGLAEVIKAAEDQQNRAFEIILPNDNGYIVGQISLAGLSYGVPIEGAVTFSVSGTQSSKIRWVYDSSSPAAPATDLTPSAPTEPETTPAETLPGEVTPEEVV